MKHKHPLLSPPEIPGIYIITNELVKKVYVGQTKNLRQRLIQWRGVFNSGGVSTANKEILEVARGSDLHDWYWSVLIELPGATTAELHAAEKVAIAQMVALFPDGSMNRTLIPAVRDTDAVHVRKSTILDPGGNSMSYRDAAAFIGCNSETLKKRLAKRRARGEHTVHVEELKATREKWLQPS